MRLDRTRRFQKPLTARHTPPRPRTPRLGSLQSSRRAKRSPAFGLALPRFAHNWPLTRAEHIRKRSLPRVRGASAIRTNSCPSEQTEAGIYDPDMASPPCKSSGRAHSAGPSMTPAESTGAAARTAFSATCRLTQPERESGRPRVTQRDASIRDIRLNNTGRRTPRRRRSTDHGTARDQCRHRPRGRNRVRIGFPE